MKPRSNLLAMALAAVICSGAIAAGSVPRAASEGDDILKRSRAIYADLRSYADTGVMINEYGSASTDEFKFVTRFNRSLRRFFLQASHRQHGIWGDPAALPTKTRGTGGPKH